MNCRGLSLVVIVAVAWFSALGLGVFDEVLASASQAESSRILELLVLVGGPLALWLAGARRMPARRARDGLRVDDARGFASGRPQDAAVGLGEAASAASRPSVADAGGGSALAVPVRAAVDHAPAAIMITDASARIEYVNEAFLLLCGYLRDEVIGRTPGMLRSGRTDEAVYRELWQTILAGNTWKGELVNRRKCGSEYWDQMAISPLRDAAGRLSHFVSVREDVSERKEREAGLQRLACVDALTGISNRRHLMERAEYERQRAERFDLPMTLLMLDVDHFKAINDRYGHATGDLAIRAVAQVCGDGMRDGDVAGRYGGEEFAVILPGTQLKGGRELAERLRRRIAAIEIEGPDGRPFRLTASVGVAEFRAGDRLEEIFTLADAALYRAKRLGRNRVVAVEDFVPCIPPADVQ